MKVSTLGRTVDSAADMPALDGRGSAVSGEADATARTRRVSGAARFQLMPGPDCSAPLGVCTTGTIDGDLRGSIAGTGVSFVVPADPSAPSVGAFVNRLVITTLAGELTCVEVGSANTAGDGEFASLCEIVDATGQMSGTTGYLTFRGTFLPNSGGSYRYEGTMTRQ